MSFNDFGRNMAWEKHGLDGLVADGHAMTEAPLHFGRPVSLRRVSDAERLQSPRVLVLFCQDFSGTV